MLRIAIILLVIASSMRVGSSPAAPGEIETLEMEILNESESAFILGDSRISIEIRDHVLRSKKELLLEWIVYSAETVSQYYGRFPVDNLYIKVQVTDGDAVRFGQAFGGESPFVRVVVGEQVTAETLRKDWIMVHEMVHLAMADVPQANRWWLEGLATYVESIARAQRGHLKEDFVWNGFYHRMPQGLPKSGDRGLDQTPTWGRTYWGGAIFCLLADIEIRKLTDNRKSLRDALRGILQDGYSMQTSATPMQIFESADRAVDVDVLVPLYQKMKTDPFPVDLGKLWQELGIDVKDDAIIYNNEAPLAPIREALLKS